MSYSYFNEKNPAPIGYCVVCQAALVAGVYHSCDSKGPKVLAQCSQCKIVYDASMEHVCSFGKIGIDQQFPILLKNDIPAEQRYPIVASLLKSAVSHMREVAIEWSMNGGNGMQMLSDAREVELIAKSFENFMTLKKNGARTASNG